MDCYLPSPTVGFFRGEPRIVVPSLVDEFLGPVRQPTPHERRNRINDFSQWGFPLLDLLKRVFHCFSAHRPRDENANRLSILLRRRLLSKTMPAVNANLNSFFGEGKNRLLRTRLTL